ncbi:MAG: biotin--[Clostridia bacterium]|nr:biotin--[acetyl-CoA-carboxylase] ligase [Clostridia bacterium]
MYSFLSKESFFANIGLQKQDVLFYELTDSTNERAREYFLSEVVTQPKLFIARAQSAGKGTRGRSFDSSEGGLYFSVLFPIDGKSLSSADVTTAAAAAVTTALKKLLGKAFEGLFIKWVNDIFIRDKKICGILCEKVISADASAFIVGVGINLMHREFPPELSSIASSVEDMTGTAIPHEDILKPILGILIPAISDGRIFRLRRLYRKFSIKKGTRITVTDGVGVSRDATVLGLSKDLSLKVLYNGGESARLISGDVRIKL